MLQAKEKEIITTRELAEEMGYSMSYISRLARRKWFKDGTMYETPGGHKRFYRKKAIAQLKSVYRNRKPR